MASETLSIAIVGFGCRLPGDAHDSESLWQLLLNGRNTWTPVPEDRFNEDAFFHRNPGHPGTTNHRGGHFINQNLANFDASFFGIPPIEAQAIDPQQRLLLEVTYEAFENAGLRLDGIRGSNTAVFVAAFTHDYERNIYKDPDDMPKYHVTGSGAAILSNRISYFYDLHGPSMTLDTGCSGSLVAFHQACRCLQAGDADMALVCGVNIILSPDHMIGMSNLQYVTLLCLVAHTKRKPPGCSVKMDALILSTPEEQDTDEEKVSLRFY